MRGRPILGFTSCESGRYPRRVVDLFAWYLPRKLWACARWRIFRGRTAFKPPPWRKPWAPEVVVIEFQGSD